MLGEGRGGQEEGEEEKIDFDHDWRSFHDRILSDDIV